MFCLLTKYAFVGHDRNAFNSLFNLFYSLHDTMTEVKMWFHGKYSLGVYLYTRLVFVNHMPLKTTDQCNRRVKKKKKQKKCVTTHHHILTLTTIRLIGTTTLPRSRLMHISSFLLIVTICCTTINMRKRHSIRITTVMVSRRRSNTSITSTVFLRLDTSASVQETSGLLQPKFSSGSFLVASVVGV
jgi:hypothetical protein